MYISSSSQDEFGFQEGANDLYQMAEDAGVDVTLNKRQGRHCSIVVNDIADFLQP